MHLFIKFERVNEISTNIKMKVPLLSTLMPQAHAEDLRYIMSVSSHSQELDTIKIYILQIKKLGMQNLSHLLTAH